MGSSQNRDFYEVDNRLIFQPDPCCSAEEWTSGCFAHSLRQFDPGDQREDLFAAYRSEGIVLDEDPSQRDFPPLDFLRDEGGNADQVGANQTDLDDLAIGAAAEGDFAEIGPRPSEFPPYLEVHGAAVMPLHRLGHVGMMNQQLLCRPRQVFGRKVPPSSKACRRIVEIPEKIGDVEGGRRPRRRIFLERGGRMRRA